MNIVKVLMLKDDMGSPSGTVVVSYAKGEVYDIPEFLAEVFVTINKSAEIHTPDDQLLEDLEDPEDLEDLEDLEDI